MKNYKIGYKVVWENYYSSYVFKKDIRVFYKSKTWITPKVEGTPLFVFKTLKDAKKYVSGFKEKLIILQVKYIPYEKRGNRTLWNLKPFSPKYIQEYWKQWHIDIRSFPKGTALASAVYRLKEM